MVYEWLCGSPPFLGTFMELAGQHLQVPPPLHKQVPEIPPAFEQVLLRALAKQPAMRFPSVQDFAAALRQAASPALATKTLPSLTTSEPHLVAWPASAFSVGRRSLAPGPGLS